MEFDDEGDGNDGLYMLDLAKKKKKKKKKKIKYKIEEQEKEQRTEEKEDQKKEELGEGEEEERGKGGGEKDGEEGGEKGGDTNDKMNDSESMIWRMPLIHNIQSQFMNFNEIKIEELVKPYQEKIKKLEDEIREKDLEINQLKFKLIQNNNTNKKEEQFMYDNMNSIHMMYQMNQMINQFSQNNMMITPMNQFNNNMINNMIYSNMMNQMNLNNNNHGMENVNIRDNNNNNEKEPKFLTIRVKMEDGKEIQIQCKTDDKMEQVINIFCAKSGCKKKDYDFIAKGKKAVEDSSVEENGILENFDYIFAIKKIKSDNNEDNIKNIFNNSDNNINQRKNQILGKQIFLSFLSTDGLETIIRMGLNNTFKDAVNEYCHKIGLSEENEGNLIFILNATKIGVNDRITLGEIRNIDQSTITVIQQNNVIGA